MFDQSVNTVKLVHNVLDCNQISINPNGLTTFFKEKRTNLKSTKMGPNIYLFCVVLVSLFQLFSSVVEIINH